MENVNWITVRTHLARWESELMQQLLAAYDIPSRIIDIGAGVYCGQGSQTTLQVPTPDHWTPYSYSVPRKKKRPVFLDLPLNVLKG